MSKVLTSMVKVLFLKCMSMFVPVTTNKHVSCYSVLDLDHTTKFQ